jgi:hypothetical protein
MKVHAKFIRYKGPPAWEDRISVSAKYPNAAALAPHVKREKELAAAKKLVRLEAVEVTEITGTYAWRNGAMNSTDWLDFSTYLPPFENGAVTLELGVEMPGEFSGSHWFYVICESHEERLLLARHLFKKRRFEFTEFGKERYYSVFGLSFVDRHLIWDNEHCVNRKKIGSSRPFDRSLTEKAHQHILPKLRTEVTVLGSRGLPQLVDHLMQSCPGSSEALLWRAVNTLCALHAKNLDDGNYPITLAHLEAMAVALALTSESETNSAVRIADAIKLAVEAYPADLHATAMQFVKQQLGINA